MGLVAAVVRARTAAAALQPYVDALYGHADRHGFDSQGLIVDEVLLDGSHHTTSRRIWPIAEAIKANLVEARLGRSGSEKKAAALAGLLRDRFLTSDPAGAGIDRLDRRRRVREQVHARQHAVPPGLGDR